MSAVPASSAASSSSNLTSLLSSLAGLGGSIYGLVNSSNLQGTANSATSNLAAIQSQQLGYANQLQSLMSNPSSVTSLPGYQFLQQQGVQALDRSAAAPGGTGLGSGGEMEALESYGQGLADQFYNQQVSTLSSLSGIPSSAQSLATALQTSGAASTSTGSSIQGLLNSLLGSSATSTALGAGGGALSAIEKLFSGDTSSSAANTDLSTLSGLSSLGYTGDTSSLGNLNLSLYNTDSSGNLLGSSAGTTSDFSNLNSGFDSGDAGLDTGTDDSSLDDLFSSFSGAGGQAANTSITGLNTTVGSNTGLTTGQALGVGAAGLGIAGDLVSGKPTGYAGAAVQGTGLYGQLTSNPSVTSAAGIGGSALGLYQGIETGGVSGDAEAAVSGAKLATSVASDTGLISGGTAGALSSALGDIAAPLALYNFAENWQSGSTASDAIGGAEAGAAIGSVIPVIGTVIGGLIGGAVGAISSAFGGGEKDPETENWNSFVPAYNKNSSVASSLTPSSAYQLLAGVMDAKTNTAGHSEPIEQVFGREGEGNLMSQMTTEINSAISSGQISKSATPSQIMSQVVEPWLTSKGSSILGDQNTSTGQDERPAIQAVLQSLIGFWQSGELTSSTSVGISGQNIAGLPAYGA